jgi:hypothetical protein
LTTIFCNNSTNKRQNKPCHSKIKWSNLLAICSIIQSTPETGETPDTVTHPTYPTHPTHSTHLGQVRIKLIHRERMDEQNDVATPAACNNLKLYTFIASRPRKNCGN